MRIIHVLNALCSGGAEVVICQLAIKQQEAGHNVMILTYSGSLDDKGDELVRMLASKGVCQKHLDIKQNYKKWVIPFKFALVIRGFCPDTINVHLPACDFFVAMAMVLKIPFRRNHRKIAYVRTVHSTMPGEVLHPWPQRFMDLSYDRVIACSQAVMLYSESSLKIDSYINNGVDLDHLPELIEKKALDNCIAESNILNLVCVGSMTTFMGMPRKRQDLVIRALAKIKDNSFKISFLGDGELKNELEQLARELGIEEQCTFLGRIENVVSFLKSTDVFILPSLAEGLSIAAIEAGCMGLPLLVSNIEAFKPFEGPATLFHQAGNLDSLVESLLALKKNRKKLTKIAYSQAKCYRSRFCLESVSLKYIEEYNLCH